jgi:hypothetical protein
MCRNQLTSRRNALKISLSDRFPLLWLKLAAIGQTTVDIMWWTRSTPENKHAALSRLKLIHEDSCGKVGRLG